VLNASTDHNYRGFDLNCPSNPDTFTPLSPSCGTPRGTEWQNEFNQYVKNNDLPALELVRMPNDHNAGTTPGRPTPRAYTADDDLQLGRLVDAVSHSPYWKSTAIFVTEDDAQNGPDHVDAHRTISQVISPYTQTGRVDSSFYSTVSMLRTMEDIVGVKPLTQFDGFATPMTASFTDRPNEATYTAVKPSQAGNFLNSPNAPMAAQSASQPLQTEDQIDMQVFNEAIWKSVKGASSTMPAPRHNLGGTAPANAPRAKSDDDG
jgi:DNA-binding beta-propeller fold protein YncE